MQYEAREGLGPASMVLFYHLKDTMKVDEAHVEGHSSLSTQLLRTAMLCDLKDGSLDRRFVIGINILVDPRKIAPTDGNDELDGNQMFFVPFRPQQEPIAVLACLSFH